MRSAQSAARPSPARGTFGVPPLPTGQPSPWMGPVLSLQAPPGHPPSRGQLPPGRVPCLSFPCRVPSSPDSGGEGRSRGPPSRASPLWPGLWTQLPPCLLLTPGVPARAKPCHLSVPCKLPAPREPARPQGGPAGGALEREAALPTPDAPNLSDLTPLPSPSPTPHSFQPGDWLLTSPLRFLQAGHQGKVSEQPPGLPSASSTGCFLCDTSCLHSVLASSRAGTLSPHTWPHTWLHTWPQTCSFWARGSYSPSVPSRGRRLPPTPLLLPPAPQLPLVVAHRVSQGPLEAVPTPSVFPMSLVCLLAGPAHHPAPQTSGFLGPTVFTPTDQTSRRVPLCLAESHGALWTESNGGAPQITSGLVGPTQN